MRSSIGSSILWCAAMVATVLTVGVSVSVGWLRFNCLVDESPVRLEALEWFCLSQLESLTLFLSLVYACVGIWLLEREKQNFYDLTPLSIAKWSYSTSATKRHDDAYRICSHFDFLFHTLEWGRHHHQRLQSSFMLSISLTVTAWFN